jgi:hypothetical protein
LGHFSHVDWSNKTYHFMLIEKITYDKTDCSMLNGNIVSCVKQELFVDWNNYRLCKTESHVY